jgi:hypothetical protein
MKHKKTLDPEPTHKVVTVEDLEEDEEILFEGTQRECQAFIRIDGRITLTIKPICEQ